MNYLLIGLSLSFQITSNKIIWLNYNPNIFSAFTAFLNSFTIFLIPIYLQRKKINNKKNYMSLIIIIFFIQLIIFFILGSRIVIFLYIIFSILSYFIFNKLNILNTAFLIICALVLIFLSGVIFNLRLVETDINLYLSLLYSNYTFVVSPSDYVLEKLDRSFFFTSLYSVYLYLIHGFYECLYMFDYSTTFMEYGKNILWLPLKIMSLFVDLNFETIRFNLRSGVFQTFIRPIYLDFKFLSPLIIFILFFLLSVPFSLLIKNKINWFCCLLVSYAWIISSQYYHHLILVPILII